MLSGKRMILRWLLQSLGILGVGYMSALFWF